jgi:hypothetical protein
MKHFYRFLISRFLENLEKIGGTNGPNPSSLPVDSEKTVSVTSSAGKSSKNRKSSNMWYIIVTRAADCREIAKFKYGKIKLILKPKRDLVRSLCSSLFFLKKSMHRQLNPEKTASSKKRKDEFIVSSEIILSTYFDEVEEYLFTSSKPFSSSKIG